MKTRAGTLSQRKAFGSPAGCNERRSFRDGGHFVNSFRKRLQNEPVDSLIDQKTGHRLGGVRMRVRVPVGCMGQSRLNVLYCQPGDQISHIVR